MRVVELWRYPAKSMQGTTVEFAIVDELGVVDDRVWAVRDEVRGGVRGAKQLGGLMRLRAGYVGEPRGDRRGPATPIEIALPDGSTLRSDDPDVDARLSAAIDHPVSLTSLAPPDDLDHYRRGAPVHDDLMTELRSIFGREGDEPLPDLSVFPPVIMEYESPPGTHHDAFPLMVMTTSALRSLAEALPGSVVDVRRFRPSLVIDTGDEPGHPELGWAGRRLRIGRGDAAVELDVTTGCPRCVMVTREIDGGVPQDPAVLRHVVRDLDQLTGAYATVAAPGRIAVGDPVELVG